MPVRNNTVSRCTEIVHGGPWAWNGLTQECVTIGWSRAQFEAAKNELDGIYELFVRHIDWHRVMLEAKSRCLFVHKEEDGCGYDNPCGESIMNAMLADDTDMRWDEKPDVDEGGPYQDLLEVGRSRHDRFVENGNDYSSFRHDR